MDAIRLLQHAKCARKHWGLQPGVRGGAGS